MSDTEIDRGRDEGRDPAWREIAKTVRRSWTDLHAAAAGFAGPGTSPEDIVQEALIKAHDCFSDLEDEKKVLPWLRKIVVNTGREVARKRTRRWEKLMQWALEQGPAQTGTRCSIPDALAKLALWRMVDGLPELQRKVVRLRVQEEMTINEIAEEIGRAPGTVKASLHRARTALRQRLERTDWPTSASGSASTCRSASAPYSAAAM